MFFSPFCLNCWFICTTEALCMIESTSSQGEITEICAVSMWDWYTGFLAWLFPYDICCTVNIVIIKRKGNDCEKWLLIHVRDMTALFFLLLSRMLVYKYIYSYCNMSIYIYAWIYMMNADEINKYCIWNLYTGTCTLYGLYIKVFMYNVF